MKKCLKIFYAFLCAVLFASCSWFNNDPVQPLPIPLFPQLNTFTITGSLTTNGAMPENFAMAMNSRTALATTPEGQTIQYKVLLLANSGDTTPITGASSESDGTSYTIKYTRSKDELSDLVLDTNLPKAKYCLFMIDFILIKNSESLLLVKCHEMSAIHFEDFYERIYTFNDMIEENRYFRALDSIEEIKESIDYVLSQKTKNKKKNFLLN